MMVREIVSTCSNPHVARAAVVSIGGDFARRLERDAADRNMSSGMLASRLVRHFVRRAADSDWEGARAASRNADMPILSGLRFILERGLELHDEDESDSAASGDWPTRARPGAFREAWRGCPA